MKKEKPEVIYTMTIEAADKLLEEMATKANAKISPDLTEFERIKMATELQAMEQQWAKMDRRQKRHVMPAFAKNSSRVKRIMSGLAFRDVAIKKAEKLVFDAKKKLDKQIAESEAQES